MTRTYFVPGVTAAVAALISINAQAVGFRLPNQDPEGIARGNANVASVANPSAIYYNPAGITNLEEGSHLRLGAYLISANVDYSSPMGATTGETDESLQPVPQIYYVKNSGDSKLTYGLGIYAPYGLGIDWQTSPFPTLANEGELKYVTVSPVVGYELNDDISVAFGLTYNYSDVDLKQSIGILPGDEFNIRGSGNDFGYTLGLQWNINDSWDFGLAYRSETEIDYDGESRATSSPIFQDYLPSQASLVFPQYVDMGVAYTHNERWSFEFNIDWTDWDAVDETVFSGTALGDLLFPLNYESSLMYEFGATKVLSDKYDLSFGYIFSENSAPDTSFTPFNTDADLQLGSIGLKRKGERFDWMIGYHFAYNNGRNVTGNQQFSLSGDTADGEYKIFNQAINLAIQFNF